MLFQHSRTLHDWAAKSRARLDTVAPLLQGSSAYSLLLHKHKRKIPRFFGCGVSSLYKLTRLLVVVIQSCLLYIVQLVKPDFLSDLTVAKVKAMTSKSYQLFPSSSLTRKSHAPRYWELWYVRIQCKAIWFNTVILGFSYWELAQAFVRGNNLGWWWQRRHNHRRRVEGYS